MKSRRFSGLVTATKRKRSDVILTDCAPLLRSSVRRSGSFLNNRPRDPSGPDRFASVTLRVRPCEEVECASIRPMTGLASLSAQGLRFGSCACLRSVIAYNALQTSAMANCTMMANSR